MREVDLLPDWLVEGLVEAEQDEKGTKQGGPEGLWQKVDAKGKSILVRSAKKKVSVPIRRVN